MDRDCWGYFTSRVPPAILSFAILDFSDMHIVHIRATLYQVMYDHINSCSIDVSSCNTEFIHIAMPKPLFPCAQLVLVLESMHGMVSLMFVM